MTVSELIQELQKLPGDAVVYASSDHDGKNKSLWFSAGINPLDDEIYFDD